MKALIGVRKVKTIKSIEYDIRSLLESIHWKKNIKGKNIFVKINAMSAELVPGRNTGPWIIDPFLKLLTETYPKAKIYMGDTNLAGSRQFDTAIKVWSYDKIAKKYNIQLVNIDRSPLITVDMKGEILRKMLLPKVVVEADTIINIPVMKTHCLTAITCTLKNLWGLLPRARHQYHPHVHEVIADINNFFRNCRLNIVDATIAMEGIGPKIGTPRICDIIYATNDRVAADSYACELMSLNKHEAPHIQYCEQKKVGTTYYKVIGDNIRPMKFKKAIMKQDTASFIEMTLRKVPYLRKIIFETPLVYIAGYLGTQYNYYISYLLRGQKKLADKIILHSRYSTYFKKISQ